MTLLTNVTYGCSLVTYGPRQRCSKSRASQPRSPVASTARPSTRCGSEDGPRLFHLSAAGVSLPPASAALETAASGRRCQDRVYGETLTGVGRTGPFARGRCGAVVRGGCQSSAARPAASARGAWLSARSKAELSWSIDLIVCWQRSWLRPTSCWRLTSDNRSANRTPRRR